MIHIRSTAIAKNAPISTLDVEWDDVAGTLSGEGADYLRSLASGGSVPLHPQPGSHQLSATPLMSHADMAAMVGWLHRLPDNLAASYPAQTQPDIESVEVIY